MRNFTSTDMVEMLRFIQAGNRSGQSRQLTVRIRNSRAELKCMTRSQYHVSSANRVYLVCEWWYDGRLSYGMSERVPYEDLAAKKCKVAVEAIYRLMGIVAE